MLSGDLSGCRAAVRHCQVFSVRPAVGCCQCCQVLSGACLTSEGICSCQVLSELSGVAVRRCRSCQSCQAAAAVRRWAVAVRCCQVVLSGCCQALTHTSHTYDIIKRRPAGLCCTYSSLYSASGPTITSAAGRPPGERRSRWRRRRKRRRRHRRAATPTQYRHMTVGPQKASW